MCTVRLILTLKYLLNLLNPFVSNQALSVLSNFILNFLDFNIMMSMNAALQDQWLNQEHYRDSGKCNYKQDLGDLFLGLPKHILVFDRTVGVLVAAHCQEYVDHSSNNGRCLMNVVKLGTILRVNLIDVLLSEPFSNDENVHPPEQSQ